MNPVPCYRATHLYPYLKFFRGIGAPVESGLRQAGLPMILMDEPGTYLPNLPTMDFLKQLSHREGIDEMPLRALGQLQLSDLSAAFVDRALSAPSLKTALESFTSLVSLEDPYVGVWISYGDTVATLCASSGCPLDPTGVRYEDWNLLIVLQAIVQAFAGSSWQPEDMAFRTPAPLSRYAYERFPDTRLHTDQTSAWITVPRELLSLPPRITPYGSRSGNSPTATALHADELTTSFTSSLKAVLNAYLPEQLTSIEFAAEIAGTSVRTLQRRLKNSDATYSDLITELRYERAARLLRESNATVLEIALEVGYEDPSHFSRAFKRIAGVSPREYRHQQSLN
jgi:AraC-like DNA-binding protein